MDGASKKHRSLKTKTFRVILLVSLLMIFVGSAGGLVLYSYSTLKSYKNEARDLIGYTMSMQDGEYIEKVFREARRVYESMPEEVRNDPTSDEFVEAVAPLIDDDYYAARNILVKCREETVNRNMALVFTDPESSAMVYVIDGDVKEWAYLPCQWQEEDLAQLESEQRSSWRLIMTYEKEYGWIGTDCDKIVDTNGDVIGYAVMDLDINDFLNSVFRFLIVLLPASLLIVAALASLSENLLRKHIISHLTSMADAAKEYTAMDKVDLDEQTQSVFEPLGINTADELEDLWRSMSAMESDVKDSIIRLREITAEQERTEAELAIATKIQMGVLPDKFPDRREFELHASMNPAKEVGGDLYDFFMIDDDHLAIVIGDVSDKGISAALFMVIARTLIKNETEHGNGDPAEIFANVNARLIEVNKAYMFVTAWLGILDISTGVVRYVNAGHECPAICRAGGRFEVMKDAHDAPLAARKKTKFRDKILTLDPNDTLYVYTDGVTDARSPENEMFGRDRMLHTLNREHNAHPETIDRNIQESIADFVNGADQFDDTTMLCLKYLGTGRD